MSQLVAFKNLTRELLSAHGESVIHTLCENEEYTAAVERAAALGVTVSLSLRDTYTDSKKYIYRLPQSPDEVPFGAQLDLCVDMVRGGYVLFICNDEGVPEQLSFSITVARTAETFLTRKMELLDYDEIEGADTVASLVEDYLDRIEAAKGGVSSVILANDAVSCEEESLPDMISDIALLPDCDTVELLGGAFAGTYVNDGSVFYSFSAFSPYMILLEARQFGFYTPHGVSFLNAEIWERFSSDVRTFCSLLSKEITFTDALTEMKLYSLEPTDRAEKQLNALTFLRAEAFRESAQKLLDWGDAQLAEKGGLSVLWP